MTAPYYADDWLTVYLGDCREVMASMPAESVHCVVTSPPYWGLRDYGIGGQLGLEPTPEAYVESMVAVFREVRRVLRKDGTVWLNLGDSYNAYNGGAGPSSALSQTASEQRPRLESGYGLRYKGLKPKDLVGIPWRVAFALQADGWYLRSDIIWSKPNPMPESVTDRPTKAHEYVFLLSKSPRYYYDADAVREPSMPSSIERQKNGWNGNEERDYANRKQNNLRSYIGSEAAMERALGGHNLRSVWQIATQPYPGAHFATFPRALVEPCIKAGTSEKGVCPECGAPWVREVEVSPLRAPRERNVGGRDDGFTRMPGGEAEWAQRAPSTTIGWRPSCTHFQAGKEVSADRPFGADGSLICKHGFYLRAYCPVCDADVSPVPATVLDPFAGSGTTGLVAQSLSRRAVLIDLSADYLVQLMDRNAQTPMGLAI